MRSERCAIPSIKRKNSPCRTLSFVLGLIRGRGVGGGIMSAIELKQVNFFLRRKNQDPRKHGLCCRIRGSDAFIRAFGRGEKHAHVHCQRHYPQRQLRRAFGGGARRRREHQGQEDGATSAAKSASSCRTLTSRSFRRSSRDEIAFGLRESRIPRPKRYKSKLKSSAIS